MLAEGVARIPATRGCLQGPQAGWLVRLWHPTTLVCGVGRAHGDAGPPQPAQTPSNAPVELSNRLTWLASTVVEDPPQLLARTTGALDSLPLIITPQSFRSTLEFEADHAILPTYLPIEDGAAAAIGAVALAAAELFELRTGRAQRCVVSQSGAGLTTAQYLFIYVQPSGQWAGMHGFDGTMAAEGTVKPHRKAYECKDGRWIFLHGGFVRTARRTAYGMAECRALAP